MGFEKDKLNREKYADFLTEIVGNPEKYKRISDSNSLSVAIDSSWGTGKTTFINMWKEKLESLKDDKNNEKFIVITYNAWKNDFVENPFESLVYTIINHKVFNSVNEIENAEKAGKNLLKTATKLGKSLIKLHVSNKYGDSAGEFVEGALEHNVEQFQNVVNFLNNKETKMDNFFKDYKEYLDSIEEIKNELNKISKEKKIIIIIDELDRCKPLFAIRLLESVKHIFDVSNISFVFALDMEQLSYSIKCIYGQNMDASGYLCRFFDYISKMPKPDTRNYIRKLIEEKPLIRKRISNFIESDEGEEPIEFSDIFEDFARNMNLSLRDINTIYSNFLILEQLELKNVNCMQAYSLYLMLLILKYKYIEIFNKIFVTNNCNISGEEIFSNYFREKNKYFCSDVFYIIMEKKEIGKMTFSIQNKGIQVHNKVIHFNGEVLTYDKGYTKDYLSKGLIQVSDATNISNCLFYDDIKKWDKIERKVLVKYIQEKLEFFDFECETKNI